MCDAVPYSSPSILFTHEIWSFGGMIKEIMLVPFLWKKWRWEKHLQNGYNTSSLVVYHAYPRAACKLLINCLIFHISMFLSFPSSPFAADACNRQKRIWMRHCIQVLRDEAHETGQQTILIFFMWEQVCCKLAESLQQLENKKRGQQSFFF